MLYAVLDELRDPKVQSKFDLISIYPRKDQKQNHIPDLEIVPAPPWLLVGVYLPLSLLLWPLSRHSVGGRLLSILPVFRSLLASSVVVDLSGIAFSDNRGLPLLAYNLACCLPAILFGKKVAKLSQAFGPFRRKLNGWCASWVLQRCHVLVARGKQSGDHLATLGIEDYSVLPDTAFSMRVNSEAYSEADRIFALAGMDRPRVVLSPSEVVARYCEKRDIDYHAEVAGFISDVVSRGYSVGLLPHSTVKTGRKNNDLMVCRAILAHLSPETRIAYHSEDYDARTLRAIIGKADFFVGSRFHSMISALSSGVPPLVIGWGHKYREVMEMFGLENWVLDWKAVSRQKLSEFFSLLEMEATEVRSHIQHNLPRVLNESKKNFALVKQLWA
jgi:polysaccharide pyruvyl transferase WcaK-like protein